MTAQAEDAHVDLTNCDREPIHVPGAIQPHGVLLALREPDLTVTQTSANVADHLVNRSIDLVINTPLGRESFFDDRAVRRAAALAQVPCITTLTGASAAAKAIRAMRQQATTVRSLQDYYTVEAEAFDAFAGEIRKVDHGFLHGTRVELGR